MPLKFVYLLLAFFSINLTEEIHAQELISPCPNIFEYELPSAEPGKWYGVLTLISDGNLVEVWVKIIFDNPTLEIGNWFGQVIKQNSTEYFIVNRKYMITANVPLPIRFYVRYDPNQPIPNVRVFRLNGRPICPEPTLAPPLSSNASAFSIANTQFKQLLKSFPSNSPSNSNKDENFFPGDFSGYKVKPQTNVDPNIACGTVAMQPTPLIISGQKTKIGEYPWHVALYYTRDGSSSYTCGGSLISKHHVLTAAHCVSKPTSQQVLNPVNLLVYLGKYYLNRATNSGLQIHKVSRITRHPNYDAAKYANDIAVLKLSQAATFNNFVRPVCLWEAATDINRLIGKFGTVVGWGYDEHGRLSEELTMLNMPLVPKDVCIYSLPEFYPKFTTLDTYCAGFTNGSSACNGDSGGGMVFQRSVANSNAKAFYLRGLISLSVALQNEAKCDPKHYVVFTDVAKYLDFIRRATADGI